MNCYYIHHTFLFTGHSLKKYCFNTTNNCYHYYYHHNKSFQTVLKTLIIYYYYSNYFINYNLFPKYVFIC